MSQLDRYCHRVMSEVLAEDSGERRTDARRIPASVQVQAVNMEKLMPSFNKTDLIRLYRHKCESDGRIHVNSVCPFTIAVATK